MDDRVSFLQMAQGYAASGQFDQPSTLAGQWLTRPEGDANWFLDLGGLLLAAGLLDLARRSFERAAGSDGTDWRPLLNIANVARETGDHDTARALYERLLRERSQHTVVRRNILIGLEYDTSVSDAERYRSASAWKVVPLGSGSLIAKNKAEVKNQAQHYPAYQPRWLAACGLLCSYKKFLAALNYRGYNNGHADRVRL